MLSAEGISFSIQHSAFSILLVVPSPDVDDIFARRRGTRRAPRASRADRRRKRSVRTSVDRDPGVRRTDSACSHRRHRTDVACGRCRGAPRRPGGSVAATRRVARRRPQRGPVHRPLQSTTGAGLMDVRTDVCSIRDAVANRDVSAVEVCQAALDRIEALDASLNAFRAIARERALARAAELDRRPDRASLPLLGVPIAIKDNMCTRGIPTTASSRILENYVPPYDATVAQRLEAAGAVIVGKTNCDEFAMGSSTENSAYGPTRNPWALDRTPGGSSGGSAAAVAAGMVPVALGSDTGGSIRQPAALCGVVGFKPSYGRVSRNGLLAFASSLDQIGPFAGSVNDAALVLSVIAGHDRCDSTSSQAAVPDFSAAVAGEGDLRGIRIGVPRHLFHEGVDPDVMQAFDAAIEVTRDRGADIVDVTLEHSPEAIPVYYVIATAEASANLARYDGVRYGFRAKDATTLTEMYDRTRGGGFGREVKRRVILGTYVLSAGYYD